MTTTKRQSTNAPAAQAAGDLSMEVTTLAERISTQTAVNWLDLFDRYGVQFLALDWQNDRVLIELVRARPEWTLGLQDGNSLLFVRAEATPAGA